MQSNKYEFSANATFQFISQNKAFRKAILASNPEKLNILLGAIHAADFNHIIFEDPDCDLYLNHLYENNQITGFVFMNVYTYLMALMQFGNQPMKAEDAAAGKHPLINKPVMIPLFKGTTINPVFKKQLNEIVKYFKKPLFQHHAHINQDFILQFCKQLPKAESYMLRIRFADNDAETSTKIPMGVLNQTSGILDSFYADGKIGTIFCDDFYLLNFQLINFLNSLIHGKHMQLIPRYGLVSDVTLKDMHLNNVHIYPLYNKHVKGNVTCVHNGITGPFLLAMHDIFHAYHASLISEPTRKFLCGNVIDKLSDNQFLASPEIGLTFEQIKPLVYGDGSLNDLLIQKAILKSGEEKYVKKFLLDTVIRFMDKVAREKTIYPVNMLNLVFALDRLFPDKFSKLLKHIDHACLSGDKRFAELSDFYQAAYQHIQALENKKISDATLQQDGLDTSGETVPAVYNPTFFPTTAPVGEPEQTMDLEDPQKPGTRPTS